MKSSILLFGRLSDQFGREREIVLPESGCTVAQLKAQLAAEDPAFAETLASSTILAAVDQEMVPDDAFIRPDQEVALFSPLSGG